MAQQKKHNLRWHFRRNLNILIESVPAFASNEAQLRASALTYYTLFAIVPIFALLFGVAKGFEIDQWLKREMTQRLSEHGEILNWLYNFADTTLREARGGLVAGIGALILCWSVVKMIGNIESAFNRVWRVKKSRTIFRKFTDYLSFLIIAPVLLLAASSATVLVSRYLRELSEKHTLISYSRPLIEFGIQCIPYLLVWVLFTFIYVFLPNTRVKLTSALFGGVIAGSLYQILQGGYIYVQMALSRYNVIYGSFSALPLFLIWMYLNWLLMLFGVILSYLYQNFDYESKRAHDNERTPGDKRLLALMLAAEISGDFSAGKPAPDMESLAERINISNTLAAELINRLLQCNVITAVNSAEYDSPGYMPSLPLEKMTVANVLDRYDDLAEADECVKNKSLLSKHTMQAIAQIQTSMQTSPGNRPLTELLRK